MKKVERNSKVELLGLSRFTFWDRYSFFAKIKFLDSAWFLVPALIVTCIALAGMSTTSGYAHEFYKEIIKPHMLADFLIELVALGLLVFWFEKLKEKRAHREESSLELVKLIGQALSLTGQIKIYLDENNVYERVDYISHLSDRLKTLIIDLGHLKMDTETEILFEMRLGLHRDNLRGELGEILELLTKPEPSKNQRLVSLVTEFKASTTQVLRAHVGK